MADRNGATRRRVVLVAAYRHRFSSLLTARSGDLPGLAVTGRTAEEVARRLPQATREALEAEGGRVRGVDAERVAAGPSGCPWPAADPVDGLADAGLRFVVVAELAEAAR